MVTDTVPVSYVSGAPAPPVNVLPEAEDVKELREEVVLVESA